MTQTLLFPDERPLVERLGGDFFRSLPQRPGVYLMRGRADALLYVGKAKNLRQRLRSYRVANPDRMPRRHLRLVRAVERIEIEECADERAALEREAHLLRSLRPPFNRAGTWAPPPRHLVWRMAGSVLEMAVTETPEPGWNIGGSFGAGGRYLRAALLRLLWLGRFPDRSAAEMPAGWFRGRFGETARLDLACGDLAGEVSTRLVTLFAGGGAEFGPWLLSQINKDGERPPFEKALIESDLEYLLESFPGSQ